MELSINIIHKSEQVERMNVLKKELEEQGIGNYNLWEGVYHPESVVTGINKAHKQIVEWAKENDLWEVIIMEDDVKFCGKGAFDYYLKNKPDDFDIYLGGIFLGVMNDENIVGRFTGMTCYCVLKRFYEKFLAVDEKEHIDIALSHLGKYVVCNPFIVTQHNGVSSNTTRYENYEAIFENRKLYNQ